MIIHGELEIKKMPTGIRNLTMQEFLSEYQGNPDRYFSLLVERKVKQFELPEIFTTHLTLSKALGLARAHQTAPKQRPRTHVADVAR